MSEPTNSASADAETIEDDLQEQGVTCPMCHSTEFVKRLLFYTYCANPIHIHKSGDPPVNTVLEFRQCVEHGVRDACVQTVFEEQAETA